MCPACEKEKIEAGRIQGKLVVGTPDDQHEQEADRVAKAVTSAVATGDRRGQFTGSEVPAPVQRQCACGGQSSPGGECEECCQKREAALARRVTRQAEHSLRRQDDGGADGGNTTTGTTDGGPLPTADAGAQSNCNLKIYSDRGCPESSLINTCPINQCCPAVAGHFVMGRKDSTSSFKGSCSGAPLETRPNDPELPCNWFYRDGGSEFLFATKLDCPIPIA